jgi:hypothetical protein
MRIAILTSERTGSTTLFHLIREHLEPSGYICHIEPFNQYLHEKLNRNVYSPDFYNDKNNVFIKTFLSEIHRPKELIGNDEAYWDWFFKYFEKIIILDRKDKTSQSESFTYHAIKGKTSGWHKRQYYDFDGIEEGHVEYRKNIFVDESKKLHEISDRGYPVVYFEDIYVNRDKTALKDILHYIGVDLNDTLYRRYILSDSFRVRLNKGESPFTGII